MPKNIKYLLSAILLVLVVLAPSGFVLAQTATTTSVPTPFLPTIPSISGATCGVSGQGTCKQVCDAYDNIDSTPTSGNSTGSCGLATSNGQTLTCCVKTYCGSNSTGIGTCVSATSCSGTTGSIGMNTSDCVPPKLCCVIPGPQNSTNANQTTSIPPTSDSDETNVFTGQTTQTSQAAPEGKTGGLVPCNGLDCSLCDLLTLIKNIINFLTGIVFALAAGFVVWGAIEIMTSGGNESKVSNGRGRIWTAVLGIAITLGAWLFIGTLLQVLTNSPSPLPWSTIQCSSASLQLKKYSTGNDSACTAKGGTCQDKSVTCKGAYTPGLCLSQTWINNPNGQCCVLNTSASNPTTPTCSRGTLTNIQSTGVIYCKLSEPVNIPGGTSICQTGTAFNRADGIIDGCGETVQNKPL